VADTLLILRKLPKDPKD